MKNDSESTFPGAIPSAQQQIDILSNFYNVNDKKIKRRSKTEIKDKTK